MKLTRKIILDEVKTRPDFYDNKKLARALGVKGDDRRELRQLLRAMVEDGALIKSDRKTFREADALPGVMVIKATAWTTATLWGSLRIGKATARRRSSSSVILDRERKNAANVTNAKP